MARLAKYSLSKTNFNTKFKILLYLNTILIIILFLMQLKK